MGRRVMGNYHARCGAGEKPESKDYLSQNLARNYGAIAQNCYGYQVAVIDLRNPTRSDGYNFLALVNRYMDQTRKKPDDLAARAKAEKYAKILAKTIINPDGGDTSRGQNQYFYDAAEGLLTAVILLLAEFLPPREIDGAAGALPGQGQEPLPGAHEPPAPGA